MKKKFNKVVGRISRKIARKYDLQEYENQIIIQSGGLYKHTYKHISEFTSIDSYNYAMSNINKIIKNLCLCILIRKENLCYILVNLKMKFVL